MARMLLGVDCWCVSVSLSYTLGVRGDKWRSGVRKAAFSPGPPITSQAVRESDRRSLSFSCSLSNYAWESWACTCAVLFAEKPRGPDRGPVRVPLEWDQTNGPTVVPSQIWDSLTHKNSFSWPGGCRMSCYFTGNKRQHDVFHLHRTSWNTDTNPLAESASAAGELSSFRNCEILSSRCSITPHSGVEKVANRNRYGCHQCNSHKLSPNLCFAVCSHSQGHIIIAGPGVYRLSLYNHVWPMRYYFLESSTYHIST